MLALPRRLLWVLLIGVLLALVLIIARHDQEPFGRLSTDDLGALAYHVALVVFIGGAVLMMVRERPSAALEAALNPEPGPWIFYVLQDKEGHHFFTDDSKAFERQVQESLPCFRAVQIPDGRAVEEHDRRGREEEERQV